MIKPKLKKGDRILIKEGRAYSRGSNPQGETVIIFTSKHSVPTRFYAICPEASGVEYWYRYDEIVKVLPKKKRKGKLIGGYAIQ